jgi:FdhD protein
MRKVTPEGSSRRRDLVVVEEPLTILWQASDGPSQKLSATMRTPGEDVELAAGLLFHEGLLRHPDELHSLSFCARGGPNELNRIRAQLRFEQRLAQQRLAHHPSQLSPQSACGLCSFDELSSPAALLKRAASLRSPRATTLEPEPELLGLALGHLQSQAPTFAATGASHAVVVTGAQGELLAAAEDVGRHNACDKAIGRLFLASKAAPAEGFTLPSGSGLLFSSRLSFELAAKAVRAGAAWIASVGAPTQLALELARRCQLPVYGFLSQERHNRYNEPPRGSH